MIYGHALQRAEVAVRRYNHTGTNYFSLRKDGGARRVSLTAQEIMEEALPIQCLEAVFVACHLTAPFADVSGGEAALERGCAPWSHLLAAGGPVSRQLQDQGGRPSLPSHCVGRAPPGEPARGARHHRHSFSTAAGQVGGARAQSKGLAGVQATEQSCTLHCTTAQHVFRAHTRASLPLRPAQTLSELIRDFQHCYTELQHALIKVYVGLPVPHDTASTADLQWRVCKVRPDKFSWDLAASVLDQFTRAAPRLLDAYLRKGAMRLALCVHSMSLTGTSRRHRSGLIHHEACGSCQRGC